MVFGDSEVKQSAQDKKTQHNIWMNFCDNIRIF